jgi:hypothetical protein
MKRSNGFWTLGVAAIILAGGPPALAQRVLLGIDAGGAKTRGEGLDNLRLGYVVAADATYALNPVIQLGARYAFANWAPAIDAFSEVIADTLDFVDIDGSSWSMEIVPVVRAVTTFDDNVVNLFAQASAGLYIIDTEITVEAQSAAGPATRAFGSDAQAHAGFSAGGGITIGKAMPVLARIYTLYTYVARDESPDQYFTFAGGVVVGIDW